MYILVGLGNPGGQYVLNRHNIGFMAVDTIVESYGGFSTPKIKFRAQIQEGAIGPNKVVICKPQTYMNLSGEAVQQLMSFYKVPLERVYVFHDDLDLDFGKIKVKMGGGHGGHNGLRSIDQHLGKDYWRVRLGIGHPGHKDAVTKYVLSNFSKDEMDVLISILGAVSNDLDLLLGAKDGGRWLNEVNKRL